MPLQGIFYFLIYSKIERLNKKQVGLHSFFHFMASCFLLPVLTDKVAFSGFVVDFFVVAIIHKFRNFYFVNEFY